MKENEDNKKAPAAKDPEVACTVLVAKTKIGGMKYGAGAKLRLAKSDAETLAGLNPPRVSIDGI